VSIDRTYRDSLLSKDSTLIHLTVMQILVRWHKAHLGGRSISNVVYILYAVNTHLHRSELFKLEIDIETHAKVNGKCDDYSEPDWTVNNSNPQRMPRHGNRTVELTRATI
jgi:hypothetical protein